MSEVTHYEGFFTTDQLTTEWWRRNAFYRTTEEVGLVLLQDNYFHYLNIGIVVGADERDAFDQVNNITFDKTLGDSEIIRAFRRLMTTGELLNVMIHTAKERGKSSVVTRGDQSIPFEKAICDIFREVGFTEQAGVLKLDL